MDIQYKTNKKVNSKKNQIRQNEQEIETIFKQLMHVW
jgi:hypothetical protein